MAGTLGNPPGRPRRRVGEREGIRVRHALPSGVMAEQVHPLSGEPLSVSPLTWSHATFVAAVNDYLARAQDIQADGLRPGARSP